MSKGLFFTGVVYKNTRDILKEEEARQRLAMEKERLELQKQQLADKRAEARRKNLSVDIPEFETQAYLPELSKDFTSSCGSFQKETNANALKINEGDLEAKNQFNSSHNNLKDQDSLYTNMSNSIKSYRKDVQEGRGDVFKTTEDGEYLFEVNYKSYLDALQENPNADRFELAKQFPVITGMINETKWKDPNLALYKTESEKNNREGGREYTLESGLEVTESFLTDKQFTRPTPIIIQGLTPDSNGNWNDPNQKKVYLGQEKLFKVGEDMLSGPEAFALEEKGITSIKDSDGSSPFMDKLMPSSGDEYKALREEYVQYLAKKYEDEAREAYPTIVETKSVKSKTKGITDADIKLLEQEAPLKLFNGVNLKEGDQYEPSFKIQPGIPIPRSAFQEVDNQDTSKIDKDITTLQADAQDRIVTKLVGVGMDKTNNPLAVVNFGPAETQALIPLSYIAGMSDVVSVIGKNKEVMRLINYAKQKGTISSKPTAEGDALFE